MLDQRRGTFRSRPPTATTAAAAAADVEVEVVVLRWQQETDVVAVDGKGFVHGERFGAGGAGAGTAAFGEGVEFETLDGGWGVVVGAFSVGVVVEEGEVYGAEGGEAGCDYGEVGFDAMLGEKGGGVRDWFVCGGERVWFWGRGG